MFSGLKSVPDRVNLILTPLQKVNKIVKKGPSKRFFRLNFALYAGLE